MLLRSARMLVLRNMPLQPVVTSVVPAWAGC